jgi:shikimate dehydrogenase
MRAPIGAATRGPILLLGAGGASRAVVVALLESGARDILIANRTPDKAEALAKEFGASVRTVAWADRSAAVADKALVVNCTDRGMIGKEALEIDLSRLKPATLVADLIYTPLETPFLADARARGCRTVNGLGLLLNQARLAFKAWFGVMPDVTPELIKAIEATF